MIMRHWMDSPIVVTHGRLREWQIFTKRKGELPNKDTGEVCFDINCYCRAIILPGVATEPTVHQNEVELYFVSNGEGVVEVGGEKKEVKDGSSFVIPPGVEHRITNIGVQDLEFIMARRPPCSDGSDNQFVVRHWTEDRHPSQFGSPFQGHWHHIYRGPEAGIHIGDLPPRKLSHPHNHSSGLDEIWYVRKGNGWHWMGREYQAQTPGWALWLEPEEVHSLMNPSDETVEYIYCSSAKLLGDKAGSAPKKEEPTPTTAGEILMALEGKINALAEAYNHTGISIHGVGANIPLIRRYVEELKKLM